jgi:hypothetical protein
VILRIAKIALVLGLAIHYSLVVFQDLGRPGGRISHVCGCGPGVVAGVAAGFRPTAVRLWDSGVGPASTGEEPQHPGNQVNQIDVR